MSVGHPMGVFRRPAQGFPCCWLPPSTCSYSQQDTPPGSALLETSVLQGLTGSGSFYLRNRVSSQRRQNSGTAALEKWFLCFIGSQSRSQSPRDLGYCTPRVNIRCGQLLVPVSPPKDWTLNLAHLQEGHRDLCSLLIVWAFACGQSGPTECLCS